VYGLVMTQDHCIFESRRQYVASGSLIYTRQLTRTIENHLQALIAGDQSKRMYVSLMLLIDMDIRHPMVIRGYIIMRPSGMGPGQEEVLAICSVITEPVANHGRSLAVSFSDFEITSM
jgi:hypothetical protein